jgi:hypothetical protein
MKLVSFTGLVFLAVVQATAAAQGQTGAIPSGPFTSTLSNNIPLAFGMNVDQAGSALGYPLVYVQGRPGSEIFLAIRSNGGSGFFPRKDKLYLQFRKGRLTGWKGDWGHNWMWQ